jgi:hypothetical protein
MSGRQDMAPVSLRLCGTELACGRLVSVRTEFLWGEEFHMNGPGVCPVHDAGWPDGDGPWGQCLITYIRAEEAKAG